MLRIKLTLLYLHVVFLFFSFTKTHHFFFNLFLRLYRGFIKLIATRIFIRKLRQNDITVPKLFKNKARKYPDQIIFYYEDDTWTYRRIDEYSDRIAHFFNSLGIKAKEEVALFMDSRPEYVATWLGLSKIGVVSALLNTNQKSDTLFHSIKSINCVAIIFGAEQLQGTEFFAFSKSLIAFRSSLSNC